MTRLEPQMAAAESAARASLVEMLQQLGSAARTELGAAREELDFIAQIQRETLALSREQRGLAFPRRRAGGEAHADRRLRPALITLQDELARHGSHATR